MNSPKVSIKKLFAKPLANYETAKWDEWNDGDYNNKTPPIDYEIEGLLMSDVDVGSSISVLRTKRNGVDVYGHFVSSKVEKILPYAEGDLIYTQNSVYILKHL